MCIGGDFFSVENKGCWSSFDYAPFDSLRSLRALRSG